MNTTLYYRSKNNGVENYYSKIDNGMLKDKNLNMTQKGIMAWILSQDDTYIINKTYIQKESGLGRQAFSTAWKGLIDAGYIKESATISPDSGKSYHYTVYENPTETSVSDSYSPTIQNPTVGNTTVGKSALNKKQLNNNQSIRNTNTKSKQKLDSDIEILFDTIKNGNTAILHYDEAENWTPNHKDIKKLQKNLKLKRYGFMILEQINILL